MIWAIVPAKLGETSKERLGAVLAPELRRRLAHAMLDDVLEALGRARGLAGIVVVSRDAQALALAQSRGACTVADSGGGLNASVQDGIEACRAHGATGVLVAMGDLPLLEAADVETALEALPSRGLVLVPSLDGTGTNLLAARPAELVRPAFGPGSLARHLELARDADVTAVLQPCAGAALDVDTPDDLERLLAGPPRTSSQRLLAAGPARAIANG